LDLDYIADREIAFITFSTRAEAEAAVKRFTSSECQYVDRVKINDCALYVSFDPKAVSREDEEKENENFFLEELNWLFSFGEKVQCKVEIYRKNGGTYDGKAIVNYSPNSNGQRVCKVFLF
jgi:hypothetical protein